MLLLLILWPFVLKQKNLILFPFVLRIQWLVLIIFALASVTFLSRSSPTPPPLLQSRRRFRHSFLVLFLDCPSVSSLCHTQISGPRFPSPKPNRPPPPPRRVVRAPTLRVDRLCVLGHHMTVLPSFPPSNPPVSSYSSPFCIVLHYLEQSLEYIPFILSVCGFPLS